MSTKTARRKVKPNKKFPHAKVDALEVREIEKHDGVSRSILKAASQAFKKWGYVKTGLTDIARGAGTSRANVYNYFPQGKEQILRELLRIKNSAFNQQFAKVIPMEGPASDILKHRLIFGIQHVRQDELTLELMADNQTSHIRQHDVVSAGDDFWRNLFEYAEARGELRPGVNADNGFRWIFLVLSSILYVSQPQSVGSIDDIQEQLEQFLMPALFV